MCAKRQLLKLMVASIIADGSIFKSNACYFKSSKKIKDRLKKFEEEIKLFRQSNLLFYVRFVILKENIFRC